VENIGSFGKLKIIGLDQRLLKEMETYNASKSIDSVAWLALDEARSLSEN